MLNFFIKRPVTTVMFVLFWVVMGVVSYPKMNVEAQPAMDFPMVTATFVYPGAGPVEIESQIIKRAEDVISEVAGVKKITSQAFESGGFVMAEFKMGVNVNDKAAEMKAKIEAVESQMPADMKKPVIEKLNPLQQSVVDIVLTGSDARSLEQFVSDDFSRKLTGLSGVASATSFGGQTRAIRVQMDPELMAARGISVLDVVGAMGAYNINVPGGKIETSANSNIVRFVGEFASVSDIANLRLSTIEGGNFKLSDIADVSDQALDISTGARFNGEPVVIVSVIKASDGNAIKISKDIRKHLPEFKQSMRNYFGSESADMQIVSDSSIAVLDETNTTIRDIVLGICLTVLTLLFFTRNWRSTVIAAVVIPASIIAGFFFMDLFGFTINNMTLLAIGTALGTLITDAIVLIESALGLLDKGHGSEYAAVEGTKQVTVRILAEAGTHVVVFLPIAFMGGIAGQFMSQFGMSVVFLTLLSLVFSFTLTPMMIAKFLKKSERAKPVKVAKKKEPLAWFKKFYEFQLRHPWRTIGMAIVIFVLSAIPMRWVGNEFAPSRDVNEINISARTPAGSTFAKSESVAAEIEKRLKDFPEIESVSAKIGTRGLQNINIKVKLQELSKRNISDKKLAQKILPVLSEIPGAEIQVRAGSGFSDAISSDMVLNVYGDDDAKRAAYASQIIAAANNIPEVQSAVLADQTPGDELKFVPDSAKMKLWGVSNQTAGVALRTALFGNDSFRYKEAGKEHPIVLEFAGVYKTQDLFGSVYLSTPKGLVPMTELGAVQETQTSPNIRRINKERITEIDINIGKSTIGPVQKKIQSVLSEINFEAGYSASFGGMSEMQAESTGEIGMAFMLAIILTFMILAAVLNSLAHPFTIATSILFSFAGVFVMLFLTGASINIAALLSFVMLVGLLVSNNILLLEPTIHEMSRGVALKTAMWEQFVSKTRMMLMTTIAVATGLIPQLWSSDGAKVSMAAVIIGGVMASLFWTYFVTPALFVIMEKLRKKK